MSVPAEPESTTLRVDAAGAGERIDRHVAARLPELSRARVAQLLAEDCVRLNGRAPRKSERLAEGDVIEVRVPPTRAAGVAAEAIPLRFLFQDEDIAVVEKPAGLVVHPAPGHPSGTLVNALLHHLDDLSGIGGVARPGIVHRLDRDTSGLLIVAKNDRAHRRLSAQLRRREVKRTYLAACWGHLDGERLSVDAPVGRSRGDRKRMGVVEGGRRAVTQFSRLERWLAADLLRAELETGRTHQIRVHLAHVGHPVVADPAYGGGGARGISGPARAWARELERRVPRQFLHAWRLRFHHPTTGEPLVFEAPLPADLAAAAEWARTTSTPTEDR